MRRLPAILAIPALALLVTAAPPTTAQAAGTQDTGFVNGAETRTDPARSPAAPLAKGDPSCGILFFSTSFGAFLEVQRLQEIGYSVEQSDDPAAIDLEGLRQYAVVVIAGIGAGLLSDQQTTFEEYVAKGGALVVHQPNAVGTLDYLPTGFEVEILDTNWCDVGPGNENGSPDPCIVAPSHPLVVGLADDDLSGDFDTAAPLGPGFTVLAENCICGSPALAAGTLGNGTIVLSTGNFSVGTLHPPTVAGITQFFDVLCSGIQVPVSDGSWSRLKSQYR